MLKVAIHDNVVFHKAEKNDKGTLVVGFKQVNEATPLELLGSNSDNTSPEDAENDFLVFPPKATEKNSTKLDTAKNNMQKIKEIKDPLNHILSQYLTKDQITWDPTKGLGITNENLDSKFTQQSVLDAVYANIVDQFIKMSAPIVKNPLTQDKKRFLTIRTSGIKHFSALRKRYLDTNPFLESMTIPAAQSKLKYTNWEVKNGFNNPNPVAQATADVPDADEVSTSSSMFASVNG